jgi:hypothetical protein
VIDPGATTGVLTWYLRNEISPGAPDAGSFAYGLSSWKPVVGDWNGQGKTTIGVVDTTGQFNIFPVWYLRNENSPGGPDVTGGLPFVYGANTWEPVGGVFSHSTPTAALEQLGGSSTMDSSASATPAGLLTVSNDLLQAMLLGRPQPQHEQSPLDAAFTSWT